MSREQASVVRLVGCALLTFGLLLACVPAAGAATLATPFSPVADAYVSTAQPKLNFGVAPQLSVSNTTDTRIAYLRFNVTGLAAPVSKATLRVWAHGASSDGIVVGSVSNTTWGERTITSKNAPTVATTPIGASAGYGADQYVDVVVTGAVTGNGLRSLALTRQGSVRDGVAFDSREAAHPPQLIIETTDSTAPAVSITSPVSGATVSTRTPTLAGAASAGAGDLSQVSVRVYAGSAASGTPLQTLSATASGGAWSANPSPLADGVYTIEAQQSDTHGNVGTSAPRTFSVDATAPAVTLTTPGETARVRSSTPALAGAAGDAAGDGAQVTVRLYSGEAAGGTALQTITVSRSGVQWSTTAATLSDGTYTAQSEQTDAAGNVGRSAAISFVVDTLAPDPSISTPTAGASLANDDPVIAGRASTAADAAADVSVDLYEGPEALGLPARVLSAPVAADGTWSLRPGRLADGAWTARARQADSAGNQGASPAITFTVDTAAPVVGVDTPAPGSQISDATPMLAGPAGTASGDDATVAVALFAGSDTAGTPAQTFTATVAGGRWSARAWALADGTYTARARQHDAASNTSTATATFTVRGSATYRETVLTDSPSAYWRLGESGGTTATSETSADSGTYINGVLLGQPGAIAGDPNNAAGFDGVNDRVSVPSSANLNDTGSLSLETWARPSRLPASTATLMRKEGQYLVRLTAAGAVTVRLYVGSGYKELTTPGIVTAGTWNHVVATWDGATMRIYVNGSERASAPVVGVRPTTANALFLASSLGTSDFFNGTLDETAIYRGALSAARVRDHWTRAGLPDTTAPTVTIVNPTAGSASSDATPTFSGTAGTDPGDGDTISLRLYQGTGATGTPLTTLQATRSGGTWSVAASSDLASGTYTAQAEQSDAAGNVGRSSAITFQIVRSAYYSEVSSDAPRAYWRFGETSGTTASSEPAGNNGLYKEALLGRPGALTSDPNTAAAFDGINDNVSVPTSPALELTDQMTLETWIKPDGLPPVTSTLLRKNGEYLVRIGSDGGVILRIWVPGVTGGSWQTGTAPFVRSGYWNHIVATRNGAATAIYVNGVLRATGTLPRPAAAPTTSTLYVATSNGNDFFKGTMDETAIYGTALSAERVRAHFDAAAVQAAPPAMTLDSPAAGSTMNTVPTFGGHGEPGPGAAATVKLYAGTSAGGTPIQELTTQLQPAGTFSVNASAALSSGTYTAQVEQSVGSTVYASAPKTFTVNTAAPPSVLVAADIAGCDTYGDEATAALLDRLPGTVIPNGDLAYEDGSASELANCYDPTWGRQRARTRPGLGSHDYRTPGAGAYFDYWGAAAGPRDQGYYSYDVGAWHVVTLNGVCDEVGGCGAGSPQEQWLRADLAAANAPCTLAVLDEPRFSSGSMHGSALSMQPLWQALDDFGVEAVVSADDHVYERFAPQEPDGTADAADGIRQFVAGTGGRSHYPFGTIQPNSQVRNNDTFGVLQLTLRDGAYDWKFVAEAGKTFSDSGTDQCH